MTRAAAEPVDDHPDVRIESHDGLGHHATVSVDGVEIPCTRILWEADFSDTAKCVLEVPQVKLSASAREIVVRYAEPPDHITWHSWKCTCGASMQSTTADYAGELFRDPANHSPWCTEMVP